MLTTREMATLRRQATGKSEADLSNDVDRIRTEQRALKAAFWQREEALRKEHYPAMERLQQEESMLLEIIGIRRGFFNLAGLVGKIIRYEGLGQYSPVLIKYGDQFVVDAVTKRGDYECIHGRRILKTSRLSERQYALSTYKFKKHEWRVIGEWKEIVA